MPRPIVGFLSYATAADRDLDDAISGLRAALEKAVRAHGATDFQLFQDKVAIRWGDDWEGVLRGTLEEAVYFLPVLTPQFFESEWCRKETELFLGRVGSDPRTLVLPIYLVSDLRSENPAMRQHDALRTRLREIQHTDLRQHRLAGWASPEARRALDALAQRVAEHAQLTRFADEMCAKAAAHLAAGELEDAAARLEDAGLAADAERVREAASALEEGEYDEVLALAAGATEARLREAWASFEGRVRAAKAGARAGSDTSEERDDVGVRVGADTRDVSRDTSDTRQSDDTRETRTGVQKRGGAPIPRQTRERWAMVVGAAVVATALVRAGMEAWPDEEVPVVRPVVRGASASCAPFQALGLYPLPTGTTFDACVAEGTDTVLSGYGDTAMPTCVAVYQWLERAGWSEVGAEGEGLVARTIYSLGTSRIAASCNPLLGEGDNTHFTLRTVSEAGPSTATLEPLRLPDSCARFEALGLVPLPEGATVRSCTPSAPDVLLTANGGASLPDCPAVRTWLQGAGWTRSTLRHELTSLRTVYRKGETKMSISCMTLVGDTPGTSITLRVPME